jgi:hypothetical protein
MKSKRGQPVVIGWREWVALPDLGVQAIKVKVDTGARSSSLHVTNLKIREEGDRSIASFIIHPAQHHSKPQIAAEVEVLEFRSIKSSSGHSTRRPVILTQLDLLGQPFPIELTLTSRDEMGFRMLLGRQALRRHFLVDSGRSYLSGKPK